MSTLGDLVNSLDIPITPVPLIEDPFSIIIKDFEKNFAQEKNEKPQYNKWNGTSLSWLTLMLKHYYEKNPKGEHFKHLLNKMLGFCKWYNNQPKENTEWHLKSPALLEWHQTVQKVVDMYLSITESDLEEIYSK